MNLQYAVDRLYETGWMPGGQDLEQLDDGRWYPSVAAVKREFARAGLELTLQQKLIFNCYHATWRPADQSAQMQQGTVIGACEREAAVYALAQLRCVQAGAMASV